MSTLQIVSKESLTICFVLGFLAGCVGSGQSPEETLYKVDFNNGNSEWATVKTLLSPDKIPTESLECWQSWLGLQACTILATTAKGQMILSSPWWLDNNHAAPGAGNLSLLTTLIWESRRAQLFRKDFLI